MPHLRIDTNIPRSKLPVGVEHELCKVISETLDRPIKNCFVTINPDQVMSVGGGIEPCAMATLLSCGRLGVAENKRHSKAITEKVETTLGISNERIVIQFFDAKPSEVGVYGSTVDDFLHLLVGK